MQPAISSNGWAAIRLVKTVINETYIYKLKAYIDPQRWAEYKTLLNKPKHIQFVAEK
jgi:hypothetical protein